MKLKTLLLPIAILIVLSGCKDELPNNPAPPIPPAPNYYPFTVGNYWIYDVYHVVDSTGEEDQLSYSDTISVIAEEEINGNSYFVIEQDSWLTQNNRKDTVYLRDSSSYIVNEEGVILFSYANFDNILSIVDYDPAPFVVEYSIQDSIENHAVPSGNFDCLNFKGRFYSTIPNNNDPDRFLDNCYAEDVGLVFQTVFYASAFGFHYERRLADFHLE